MEAKMKEKIELKEALWGQDSAQIALRRKR